MIISAIKIKLFYLLLNLGMQLHILFSLRKCETTALYAITTVPAMFQQQVQQESDETIRYPASGIFESYANTVQCLRL
jgi:hypothetical protein